GAAKSRSSGGGAEAAEAVDRRARREAGGGGRGSRREQARDREQADREQTDREQAGGGRGRRLGGDGRRAADSGDQEVKSLAALVALCGLARAAGPPTVAVMPFKDLSGEKGSIGEAIR